MIWPSFIHPTDVIRMQELTTMQGSRCVFSYSVNDKLVASVPCCAFLCHALNQIMLQCNDGVMLQSYDLRIF